MTEHVDIETPNVCPNCQSTTLLQTEITGGLSVESKADTEVNGMEIRCLGCGHIEIRPAESLKPPDD